VSASITARLAPTIGAAEAVCDLVSTGETLRQNGLRVIETILRSEAVLLGANDQRDAAGVAVLRTAIESVLAARPKRYLMLNAPDDALDAIVALLPGSRRLVDQLDADGWPVLAEGPGWRVYAVP
jgi:ATP phosphoribosyltransferase